MGRSPQFDQVFRVLGKALQGPATRRQVLKSAAIGATAVAAAPILARQSQAVRIAIVGGGLSGLACADRLQTKGYGCMVYEAASRFGGRCYSNRTLVPGMAAENGGEFIDTGHKTMINYAREFGLARETVIKTPGEERFYFQGQFHEEADVVEQFRLVVDRMQGDLRSISGGASFFSKNQADIDFDNLDLASYFASRCQGYPLIEAVLNEAYLAEYGLETSQQSTLNFLGFMRLNRQSKFEPFGVSDERYHLTDGNDGVVQGLRNKLTSPLLLGARLTRLGRNAQGKYQLYFNGSTQPELADYVVLTIPYSVLRTITIDASVGLSADKIRAIKTLGYGNNAKTMVAFNGPVWRAQGSSGGTYSDLPNLQNTWETNPANAGAGAIITDYASGTRGQNLSPANVQTQVSAFLNDLNIVIPGVKAAARKSGNQYVAHLEHWPSNPLSRGSYTCYLPGQFTTVEGLTGQAAGALKFAGEHADSFYSWQGYMEGACLSGIRAANEVLADLR